MKVSYNWLREYVPFNISSEELAARLTSAGLEVEMIHNIGSELQEIIVGKVLSVQKHPNADKLSLCKVDIGEEKLDIICGASNVQKDQKVPVILIGSRLPDGTKINKTKIRDVYSYGMICSEKELGLSDNALGIMVLPEEINIGKKFIDEMSLKDTILEINVTPNRPDCLSIIGIAREISCLLRLPFIIPDYNLKEEEKDVFTFITINNHVPNLCPRYTARVIYDVNVAPSPLSMRQRLQSVGIRPINNIVDITNYILIEFGHPLHAFDLRFINGNVIQIRQAKQKEIFETLDKIKRELTSDMLVIGDDKNVIALAGIMGGHLSGIKDDTTSIILESAYFSPSSVRKTSKFLGLSTESSYRFERGTDINGLVNASKKAAFLINDLSGGKIARGMIDSYPHHLPQKTVSLRPLRVNKILGTSIPLTEIENILVRLNFIPNNIDKTDMIEFTVPSFRTDITREIDLIEEVARIFGYDRIKSTIPITALSNNSLPVIQNLINKVKNTLISQGINETISYSFISSLQYDKICLPLDDKKRHAIKIKNCLTPEQSLMRTLLLPSMMNTLDLNFKHGNFNLKFFEIGRVFLPEEGFELPYEEMYLIIALTGKFSSGWDTKEHEVDIFDLKGIMETLLNNVGLINCKFVKINYPSFNPNKCFSIVNSDITLGIGGEIHPDVLENYKFEQPIFTIELSIDKIMASISKLNEKVFQPLSIYPSVTRDLALLVKNSTTYEQIISVISESEKHLIEKIDLFDLFQGKSIEPGYKSMAFRIIFRSQKNTLQDEDINKIINKILLNLSKKLNVELRK
ncbi:MAG: phenylalanine--tRNA ligase subunit beta [Candidatus Firestonebacteria bacterium]|nr:phenylalanine--tRNA ligase subunit beta [Candidatus Firestonebacteria bacterium]